MRPTKREIVTLPTGLVKALLLGLAHVCLLVAPCDICFGTVAIDSISNAAIPWGGIYIDTAVGHNINPRPGCETLKYSITSGPDSLTIDSVTGEMVWMTTGEDICDHQIVVGVSDGCDGTASTSFAVCVFNEPPVMTVAIDTVVTMWGGVASGVGAVSAIDPDYGPGQLVFLQVGFNGPEPPIVNPENGDWEWTTTQHPWYVGIHNICISSSDAAGTCHPCSSHNSDSAEIAIVVYICGDINFSYSVTIDVADLVYLVTYMFSGGPAPIALSAADFDGTPGITISDLVYLVDYMFNDGPEPACEE